MSSASEQRVTARMIRTKDGRTIPEYQVDGVGYGSLSALRAGLQNR